MSKFLKAKIVNTGERTLIAVDKISSVTEEGKGTIVEMSNGDVHRIDLGFQSVANRIAKDDE